MKRGKGWPKCENTKRNQKAKSDPKTLANNGVQREKIKNKKIATETSLPSDVLHLHSRY